MYNKEVYKLLKCIPIRCYWRLDRLYSILAQIQPWLGYIVNTNNIQFKTK